ncbi:MAG: DUF3040 domain-containing protein [Acidimicrobiia bacterium]
MPLDDREQRILAEIERQFYEEDPGLARAVRNIDRPGLRRLGIRLPIAGLIAGALLLLFTFTTSEVVALVGFVIMVLSATALVHSLRTRGGEGGAGQRGSRTWTSRIRTGWPFRRP